MRRILLILLVLTLANVAMAAEYCVVTGIVKEESGKPVAGVKVEIRRARTGEADYRPDEGMTSFNRDKNIFAWGESDEDGRYAIKGVKKPGAYMLVIRGAKDYLRVEAPISIDISTGDEFEADIVVRRVGGRGEPAPDRSAELKAAMAAAQQAERGGKLDDAIGHLQKASEIVPDSPIPHFHLARLELQNGNGQDALEEIQLATTADESCGDCWVLAASIQRSLGNLDSAKVAGEKAVEVAPDLPTGHGVLGVVLYEQKDFANAHQHLEAAANAGDPDPNVHLFLANCYFMQKDVEKAKTAYEAYLERFPNAPNKDQVERILNMISGQQ